MQSEAAAVVIITVVIIAFLKGAYHSYKENQDLHSKKHNLDEEIKDLRQKVKELEKQRSR